MAEKLNPTGNLHFFPRIAAKRSGPGSGLAESLQKMAKKLDQLDQEIKKSLSRLEKEIQDKRSKKAPSQEDLRREIEGLKGEFKDRIHEIAVSLKDSLKTRSEEKFSLWEALRKWVPGMGLISNLSSFDPMARLPDEEIDAFGRDPAFEQKLKPFFDFLYYRYWRITTHGLENIPSKGRALLVANHSGTLPYDGSMIRLAISNDHPAQRDVRFLVEDFVYYLPFIGTFMYRVGGVRASRENAERLLKSEHLVAVFPEGVKGIGKYYSQRYHLQRFGRGGFIKLALDTQSPIIPVAVIGAEEIHPILFRSSLLAKPLGIPYIPITPTLPLLGPLGLIPFPTKWSIHFGAPIDLSNYGKETLEDELEIHKLSEMVRQTIQRMVTEALKKRSSVFWG